MQIETDSREGWEDEKLDVMVLFAFVRVTIHDILQTDGISRWVAFRQMFELSCCAHHSGSTRRGCCKKNLSSPSPR